MYLPLHFLGTLSSDFEKIYSVTKKETIKFTDTTGYTFEISQITFVFISNARILATA